MICTQCRFRLKFCLKIKQIKQRVINKREKWEKGECTKCSGQVVIRYPKQREKRKRQAYFYTQYWKCLDCKTMFMDERFKQYN